MLNGQWWESLLDDTKNLTAPFVFKNVFHEHVADLQSLTMNVFKDLAQDGSDLLRFRVWVEDESGKINESTVCQ